MRLISIAAAVLGLAVALGAFGAHALRESLEAADRADTWTTAVLYQFVHGLALLAGAIWQACDSSAARSRPVRVASGLWLAGIVLFSGSLYALGLGAPRWFGAVTPFGGVCFLGGWVLLAWGAWRLRPGERRVP